jgi:hypothetical protein
VAPSVRQRPEAENRIKGPSPRRRRPCSTGWPLAAEKGPAFQESRPLAPASCELLGRDVHAGTESIRPCLPACQPALSTNSPHPFSFNSVRLAALLSPRWQRARHRTRLDIRSHKASGRGAAGTDDRAAALFRCRAARPTLSCLLAGRLEVRRRVVARTSPVPESSPAKTQSPPPLSPHTRRMARSAGRVRAAGRELTSLALRPDHRRRSRHSSSPSLASPLPKMPITAHSNLSLFAIPTAYVIAFLPQCVPATCPACCSLLRGRGAIFWLTGRALPLLDNRPHQHHQARLVRLVPSLHVDHRRSLC